MNDPLPLPISPSPFNVTPTQITTYTAKPNELVQVDPTAGGFTVTLPTVATCKGYSVWIKNVNTSTNAVTVAAASTNTIDSAATTSLAASHGILRLVSDGGVNWNVC